MKTTDELLKIASKSTITVLLQGESGTGKEVAARKLHRESPRKNGPFVALNCGAIAENLIESTLEGSEKGSFTGSTRDQKGVVRAAEGGTLFLDEIGELPYNCQSRLLRILQEKTVMPIGSTRSIPVDFRLVCATNRNLRREIQAGKFREDLFFRLNVFPIRLMPLRERSDFDSLAQELWKDAEKMEDSLLDDTDMGRLKMYRWPGNVRQLKNVLERYALLKPHGVSLEDILNEEFMEQFESDALEREFSSASNCLCDFHTDYPGFPVPHTQRMPYTPPWEIIESTLRRFSGNKVQTAKALGISRSNLYLQIRKAEFEKLKKVV